MNEPNYYAIIPAPVRYCEDITPNAKLLYGEISALCKQEGFCWATNTYFANLYKVGSSTISEWVSSLSRNRFIRISIDPSKGNERKIFLNDDPHRHLPMTSSGKSVEGSSGKTDSHIESTTRKKKEAFTLPEDKKPRAGTVTPTIRPSQEEIVAFFVSNLKLPRTDGEYFFHTMEAGGWKRGKEPVKNWINHASSWKLAGHFPSQKNGGSAFLPPAQQKLNMKL